MFRPKLPAPSAQRKVGFLAPRVVQRSASIPLLAEHKADAAIDLADYYYDSKAPAGTAAVTVGLDKIEVKGTYNGRPYSGGFSYAKRKLPRTNVVKGTWRIWNCFTHFAYELDNLQIEPKGTGTGDIVVYHLADLASKASIPYIVAGHITGARDKFYTPLGFKDFEDQEKYKDLEAKSVQLGQQMDATKDRDVFLALMKKKAVLNQKVEDNMIYVATDELLLKSRQRFSARWTLRPR